MNNPKEIAPCLLRRFQSDCVLGHHRPSDIWRRLLELPTVAEWLHHPHDAGPEDRLTSIGIGTGLETTRWLSTPVRLAAPRDASLRENQF